MSATIFLHGPFEFGAEAIEGDDPFVTLEIVTKGATVKLLRVSRDDVGALVHAGLLAEGMLPGPGPTAPDVTDPTGPSASGSSEPPPPAAHCPICGGKLAEDGSHISALSGATIPAEPEQVAL